MLAHRSPGGFRLVSGEEATRDRVGSSAWLLLLSLLVHSPILSLVLLDPSRATPLGDSQQYLALANNLLLHHVFSLDVSPPFTMEVMRTPGYPLLLAGLQVLAGHSMLAVALVQAALRTLGAFLLLGIGERVLKSRRAGWLASVLWLIAPLPTILTGTVLTETLFTALLLLTLWFLSRAPSWQNALLAGLFFGWALVTRPIAMLLIPWVLLMILVRRPLHLALVQVLPLTLGVGVTIGPWLAETSAQFRTPILSTIGADNLAYYTSASILSHEQGISFAASRQQIEALIQERLTQFQAVHGAPPNPSEQAALTSQVASSVLLAHPLQSAWFNLIDSYNTLRPGISYTVLFREPGRLPLAVAEGSDFSPALSALGQPLVLAVTIILFLFYLPLYVFSALGSLRLLWKNCWKAMVALVLPSAILLYAPGASGTGRFRVPFEPLLCLLAAYAVLEAIQVLRPRARERSRPRE